jgi:hypothetical protein
MSPRSAACLLLLAIAACAPATEWTRAGTPMGQRKADEKSCLDIANYQAFDESNMSKAIYPPYKDTQFSEGGGGDGDGSGRGTSYSQRGARVYELSEYCMQQRGYALVPVQKK